MDFLMGKNLELGANTSKNISSLYVLSQERACLHDLNNKKIPPLGSRGILKCIIAMPYVFSLIQPPMPLVLQLLQNLHCIRRLDCQQREMSHLFQSHLFQTVSRQMQL